MFEILSEMLTFEGMGSLSHFPNLVFLLEVLALLWLGKLAYGWTSPFKLEHQMVVTDNKAITLNFTAYLIGLVVILEGVLEGVSDDVLASMCDLAAWGVIGLVLLLVAGKLNDRLLLVGFKAPVEMLERQNLSAALVVAGGYLGSAAMIRSVVVGETLGWALDLGLTVFYFALGQLGLWVYGWLYQRITGYDDLKEIAAGNPAAGINLGINLAAMGFLMALPLRQSYSLVWYLAWFLLGNATLLGFRFALTKLIIPSQGLDQEIERDRNWGIACLEGAFSVGAVLVLQNLFG